jgi:hypothetical protein
MAEIISSFLVIGYILLIQSFIELDFKIKDQEAFDYRGNIYKCELIGESNAKGVKQIKQ